MRGRARDKYVTNNSARIGILQLKRRTRYVRPTLRPVCTTSAIHRPKLRGLHLHLGVEDRKHLLTISMQVPEPVLHQATYITGTWQGSGSGTRPVTGVITGNGNSIKCGWSPPPSRNSNVANLILVGSLTYTPGYFHDEPLARESGFVLPMASLDGAVTASMSMATCFRIWGLAMFPVQRKDGLSYKFSDGCLGFAPTLTLAPERSRSYEPRTSSGGANRRHEDHATRQHGKDQEAAAYRSTSTCACE
jgi:hypothetical protein